MKTPWSMLLTLKKKKNADYNPPKTLKLECTPRYILSSGQFSSGIVSLFLDTTPAVTLAVTTVRTWLGPKPVVQNTFVI